MRIPGLLAATVFLGLAGPAHAVGESDANGFPNWQERLIHEWMNRARADPQVEMAKCGADCGDAACYLPIAPLSYDVRLNRSARFHSDEMLKQGYFAHDSACSVVNDIDALYPASCDGAASCACQGGVQQCMGMCTSFSARVSLFGVSASGEIIAGAPDPDQAFYQWLFEPFAGTACGYVQGPPTTNGHRWNILESTGGVGVGMTGSAVGDFSFGGGAVPAQIPSGAHYPRQAASVDVWANWYDTAGPKSALVDVDGACVPMTLQRGSAPNGAFQASLAGVGSGCHRYFFLFQDASGADVTFPTTGSLGIGPQGSCADWDPARPAQGAGCSCVPDCAGRSCGSDGCGGLCGMTCPTGSDGGTTDPMTNPDAGSSGCGCSVGGAQPPAAAWGWLIAVGCLIARRVRRRPYGPGLIT